MPDTTTVKVLIVEDDEFLLKMYHKKFEVAGFDVQIAPNGEEGVAKAKSFQPNIILMDIMMPKLNGIQALEQMKADPSIASIPVVILTNLSNTDDASVAISKGAIKYVIKSEVTPDQVVEIAQEVLAQPAVPAPTTPGITAAASSSQAKAA